LTLDEIFTQCTNVHCMKREGLKAASYIAAMCKHASYIGSRLRPCSTGIMEGRQAGRPRQAPAIHTRPRPKFCSKTLTMVQSVWRYFFSYFRIFLFHYQIFKSDFFFVISFYYFVIRFYYRAIK
jgi:hypothetical protein